VEELTMSRVDAGSSTAYLVDAGVVNWVLLQEGTDLTLIDGGYPGQADKVVESIERIGRRPEDIRGALLTHAHVDHLGGLVKLQQRYGFDVYMDPVEVAHARRDYLQQANAATLASIPLRNLPLVLRWMSKVLPLGVLSRKGLQGLAFGETGPLDLPGRPEPVAAHGHTDGHSAYLVASGQALVSGDALVSGHDVSRITGPQCLHGAFQHDAAANRRAVEHFTTLDADTLLAGHGPFHRGSVAKAAQQALNLAN